MPTFQLVSRTSEDYRAEALSRRPWLTIVAPYRKQLAASGMVKPCSLHAKPTQALIGIPSDRLSGSLQAGLAQCHVDTCCLHGLTHGCWSGVADGRGKSQLALSARSSAGPAD